MEPQAALKAVCGATGEGAGRPNRGNPQKFHTLWKFPGLRSAFESRLGCLRRRIIAHPSRHASPPIIEIVESIEIRTRWHPEPTPAPPPSLHPPPSPPPPT